jgi:hypothetical protein
MKEPNPWRWLGVIVWTGIILVYFACGNHIW